MSDQIGRNDQTRTRATETLIKQTKATVVQSITRARPRHGNGCSSTEARSSRSPATYVPAFSPLSPSSHSSLPDNAVDHGHVDPNGQVSEPPLSPKSFISDPPAVLGPSAGSAPLSGRTRFSLPLPQSLHRPPHHHPRPCGGSSPYRPHVLLSTP